MTHQEILRLKVRRADLDKKITIGDYMYDLLRTLWEEEDGFRGKRPFGNSGWQYDIYNTLIKAGLVTGTLDTSDPEQTYIATLDEDQARLFVLDNIIKPYFKQ